MIQFLSLFIQVVVTIIISKRHMLISRYDPVFVFVYSGGCDHYHKQKKKCWYPDIIQFLSLFIQVVVAIIISKKHCWYPDMIQFLSLFIQVVVTIIISKRQMLISRHDPVFVFVYSGGCDNNHKQKTNVDIQT